MGEMFLFPEGFVWGTATASFQIEGGIEERGRCIWDDFCRWPGKVLNGDTGDVADDHYHRYGEDVALMQSMGLNGYRFSISWPRVLPEDVGKVSDKGLGFYDRLVDALLEAGITPYVTLYHWDLPSALQRVGGWTVRDTAYRFADYAAVVAERLGDRVSHWITHNEPWVVAFLGNMMGIHAPGWEDVSQALQVAHHLLLSHGLSVPILRLAGGEQTQVGITLNLSPAYAASDSEADLAAARVHDGHHNRWFLDPVLKGSYPEDMWSLYGYRVPRMDVDDLEVIARPMDFLGVNYYTRALIEADPEGGLLGTRSLHPAGEYTAMDWEVFPQGLTDLLVRLDKDYCHPALFITENGCAYEDLLTKDGAVHDVKRADYYRKHLLACHNAISQGVDLRGHFAWSLLDNFEWSFGYSRRFGLTFVDFNAQARYLKDSGRQYARIVAANGLEG